MLAILLLADAGKLQRWLPIGWFREVQAVTGLHPIVAEHKDKLIAESKKIGIRVVITDDFRSTEEQDALYRKGRSDGGAIVTQVKGGQSFHNYGLAIDFALGVAGGKVIWDLEYDGNGNGKSDWMEVVAIAKRLGFSWGGDWASFPDYPHLQMDFGYSIGELQRGWRPPEQTS
ncbi:M15 family metallopeptidase [Cohnella cholangitidis]|uniref:M15 family metallopeptidase n=2 Tax=Cohnella cholangitidis TaxID=2598458 RepID=A0A7G5C745_9BACL|nr:M15 family metallopeptidase [Cohnella cholangitidis]